MKSRFRTVQEHKGSWPDNVRLLGLDIGRKTIGVAVCDSDQRMASPVTTIRRTKFAKDAVELEKLVKEYDVRGIIAGWPINMDGSCGPSCDMVMSFLDELARVPNFVELSPYVALWDERLSTDAVDGLWDNSVRKRKAKEKGETDALAATLILDGALSYRREEIN